MNVVSVLNENSPDAIFSYTGWSEIEVQTVSTISEDPSSNFLYIDFLKHKRQ